MLGYQSQLPSQKNIKLWVMILILLEQLVYPFIDSTHEISKIKLKTALENINQ